MTKRLACSLLLAAASLFAWTKLDLKNGDFEEAESHWNYGNKLAFISEEAARNGKYGLRVLDKDVVIGCGVNSGRVLVTPGKSYAVRFWTRSRGNSLGCGIYLTYYTEDRKAINTEAKGNQLIYSMKESRTWKENIFITKAPEEARAISIWIHSFSTSFADVDIDDIEILELTEEEAKTMTTTTSNMSNTYPALSPDRIRELEEMLPEKPMGLGVPASNREVWDKFAATNEGKNIIKAAMPLLNETFPELPDDLYLQFTRIGNRSNYEAVYNKRNSWIVRLAIAECLEYKGRFLPKLEEFLDQFLSQKSWVLPAHDGRLTVFNNILLYPDLTGSSVTAMIAYIDWFLQDKLKPETRQRIRDEAYRRSITPWQEVYRTGKLGSGRWWMVSLFNWNAVCTCNMLSASLILMESRHDRAEALAAMETSNKYFYRGFTSDGYCSEGLGYWSYGFGHFLTMGEIVLASTNGKLNIFDDDPIILKCCEYARNIMVEDGVAPAYADCGFNANPGQYNLAIIQRHYPELLLKPVQEPELPLSMLYFAIFAFSDGKPIDPSVIQPIPPVSFFDQAGILICRSKDDQGFTFGAAIKGGNNNESHNHNDVGSYLIVANKSPLVCDPGGEVYSRRTFSSERYTSKVLNSYGHDVPVVAGQLQLTGPDAKGVITEPVFTDETSSILIDMTSCYDVPELVSLTRRFTFDRVNRKISITDNVEFKTPQTFEDAIITSSFHRVNSKSQVQFYDQKSVVTADISVTGADWTLEEEFIDNPNRVSPTRFGIKLDKPVLKATVECVYTAALVDESFDTYYKEPDLSKLSLDQKAAITVQGEDFSFEHGGKAGVLAKVAANPPKDGKSIYLWDGRGHELGWTFEVPKDGSYIVTIRYCHDINRIVMREFRYDSAPDKFICNFPPTGGWSNNRNDWKMTTLSTKGQPIILKLAKGSHTIYMKNVDGSGLNFDQLTLVPLK